MSKRLIATLALATVTASLSACGGGGSKPAATVTVTASPSASSSPSPSPSQSSEPVATVSTSTTCTVVLGSPSIDKSPLAVMADFLNNKAPDEHDLAVASRNFTDIKTSDATARPPLKGQLDSYIASLQPYMDKLESGRSASLRVAALKTAGFEILRICTPYLS